MKPNPEELSTAISHSYQNRDEIQRSEQCGCFHCLARFTPSEISLWTDSIDPDDDDSGALRSDSDRYPGMTAICPRCEYDSVLGSSSGYMLTDDFLKLLHDHWHQSENPKAQQVGSSNGG
jgi:hypothetical protein